MSGSKDGAWLSDAKLIAGIDVLNNQHPLNCDIFGTLNVNATLTSGSIEIGKVDQGHAGTEAWLVTDNPSTNANVSSITVTTSSTPLLGTNMSRKGVIIQCKDSPLYVIIGSTSATTSLYSYYVLKLNALELDNYYGPVSAVVATGSALVQVTEKI